MVLPSSVDIDRLEREDLVTFINASFACTGQAEYYTDARGHDVSIHFLHDYVQGNYRRLYALTLAAGINHFNQCEAVLRLLGAGAPSHPDDRAEESALLSETLRRLPTARLWRLLAELRTRRVNNRRTRAIVRDVLSMRGNVALDAIKYRPKVRDVVRHTHAPVPHEVSAFLFGDARRREQPYETALFEWHRRARTDPEALYQLPFTVAEGLAAHHGIARETFLRRIEPMLTPLERLRVQGRAERAGLVLDVDLSRAGLTRLCLYVLSLPPAVRVQREGELDAALRGAADRVLRRAPMALGRVAAVLDRSHSSSGSHEKRRRALAVALGVAHLLEASSRVFHAFWTPSIDGAPALSALDASGVTDLATPLIEALRWGAELVVIVSDGYENAPRGGVAEVVRFVRSTRGAEVLKRNVTIVHANPVFDHERFSPRALAPSLPTVGLRDAEDLFIMLAFARFAAGNGTLRELEDWLVARMRRYLAPPRARDVVPMTLDDEEAP